jgi:hypothetical protein
MSDPDVLRRVRDRVLASDTTDRSVQEIDDTAARWSGRSAGRTNRRWHSGWSSWFLIGERLMQLAEEDGPHRRPRRLAAARPAASLVTRDRRTVRLVGFRPQTFDSG